MKRSCYLVILAILLFVPLVVDFVMIHGPVNLLLRDVLFVEGFLLLIFGAQSGEYVWNFVRNWRKMRRENNYPTELVVGLSLLIVGAVYVGIALLLPAGAIL